MNDQADSEGTTMRPAAMSITYDGPRGPLFKALADARKHFKPLSKTDEVEVQGKEGKRGYTFQYAPLDVVIASLEPGWQAAGLAVIQVPDADFVHTIVAFEGSSMTCSCAIPPWTGAQGFGSAVAYIRRYQLKAIFCVNDAEDDDANAAEGNQASFSKRPQPKAAPKQTNTVTKETADEVFAAGKDKGLSRPDFLAKAVEVCGKPWVEYIEGDAKKLLAALVMK